MCFHVLLCVVVLLALLYCFSTEAIHATTDYLNYTTRIV